MQVFLSSRTWTNFYTSFESPELWLLWLFGAYLLLHTVCSDGLWPSIFLTLKKTRFWQQNLYTNHVVYLISSSVITPEITFEILPHQTVFSFLSTIKVDFWKNHLGEWLRRKKPSIPLNLYLNSGVKSIYFFHVRNIEGQTSFEHTVMSLLLK